MKKFIFTLSALGLASGAQAADLSKNVWSYISGTSRLQPMMQSNKDGMVQKMWMTPTDLQAAFGLFVYAPKLSTNHWLFALAGPQLPAADYLGTAKWSKADVIRDAKDSKFVLHFNRLQGGLFNGLYMVDETVVEDGEQMRMLMLLTPQMYDLMKKNRNLQNTVSR